MKPTTFILESGDQIREANLKACIAEIHKAGKKAAVTVDVYEHKQTTLQLNIFWAWCRFLALHFREAGMPCSEEAVHDWILMEVYGFYVDPFGQKRPSRTLTKPKKITKEESIELLNEFQAWSNEKFGIELPDRFGDWRVAA